MSPTEQRVLRTAIDCLDGELQRLRDGRAGVINSGNQQAFDEHLFKTGEIALAHGYLNAMVKEPVTTPRRPIGRMIKLCG